MIIYYISFIYVYTNIFFHGCTPMKTQTVTRTALSASLVFAATYFLRIPLPSFQGAYVNPGDCVIFLTACLLGGLPAAFAGALGAAAADIAAGAAVYAPATALIKFAMGLVSGRICFGKPKFAAAAAAAGGAVMAAGYALYELLLFGFAYAAAAFPMNLVQAAGAAVITVCVCPALGKLRGSV